jgi:transitional endoplasmic reticulum ATPase
VPARGGGLGEPQVTERVVNTILAEMDGLEELQSVVVIGATNRPNLVDPALLRPGRFDELIYVGVPNSAGRRRILAIQTQKMPLADDVDLDVIAERTDRFTGADLEDVVRRAGLIALRESIEAKEVRQVHFEAALTESRASVTSEMERDYEQIAAKLKQDAASIQPIGFITPGQLSPRGEKRG